MVCHGGIREEGVEVFQHFGVYYCYYVFSLFLGIWVDGDDVLVQKLPDFEGLESVQPDEEHESFYGLHAWGEVDVFYVPQYKYEVFRFEQFPKRLFLPEKVEGGGGLSIVVFFEEGEGVGEHK